MKRVTPKSLNEELNKMRKLMNFDISQNSHDVLSEENFNDNVKGSIIDPQEKECDRVYGGPPEVSFEMTNKLNSLLKRELKKIEEQTKVKIVATGPDNIYFEVGDVQLPLSESGRGLYMFEVSDRYIPFATDISLSLVKEELLQDKCFKLLYDRYDTIKNQIDGETIEMRLIPSGAQPIRLKMMIVGNKKRLKKAIKRSTGKLVKIEDITLSTFSSKFFIKLNKDLYGEIESSFGVNLTRIDINGAELPNEWGDPGSDVNNNKCYCDDAITGEKIEYPCNGELPERCKVHDDPIVFDFVVEANKNFDFDDAVLTDEAKEIINKNIVDKWDPIPQNRKDGYLDFIKDKKINVNAYASIDALSNFKVSGGYEPCKKTGQLRKEYNKCLSQARAEAVVEYLKTIADGAFKDINFVANGMGETNRFSGLEWDNEKEPKTNSNGVQIDEKSPHSTTKTKSDRRFEVKFPKWHTED